MLEEKSLREFVALTASSAPVPGGGSVAALTAALASSLIAMLCNLTVDKIGYEQKWEAMKKIAKDTEKKAQSFLTDIQYDCDAFESYMKALKMPKGTDEQISERATALEDAIKLATKVPLTLAEEACTLFDVAEFAIQNGNKGATSDGAVAVLLLKTAVLSSLYNVKINLPSIKDKRLADELADRAKKAEQFAIKREKEILECVKL